MFLCIEINHDTCTECITAGHKIVAGTLSLVQTCKVQVCKNVNKSFEHGIFSLDAAFQ